MFIILLFIWAERSVFYGLRSKFTSSLFGFGMRATYIYIYIYTKGRVFNEIGRWDESHVLVSINKISLEHKSHVKQIRHTGHCRNIAAVMASMKFKGGEKRGKMKSKNQFISDNL